MEMTGGFIEFTFPDIPSVHCLFSTRAAGDLSPGLDGANDQRRAALMRNAGLAAWAELRQVHGDVVVPADPTDRPAAGGHQVADGHFTTTPGIGLVIRTADCQPLFFTRRDGGAVAALHVGWRGNAVNFPGRAVAGICRAFGCSPADLSVVRGPGLGPEAAEFVNFDREWPPEFRSWLNRKRRTVNLWDLTRHQLQAAGVRPLGIHSIDLCTRNNPSLFFSHRRGDGGRHANLVWIEKPESRQTKSRTAQ